MYQTLERVFHHISKHLKVRQKYSAARRIFNSLLGVWKCDETRSLVFDILLQAPVMCHWLLKKGYVQWQSKATQESQEICAVTTD